jgi:hypothetical protein
MSRFPGGVLCAVAAIMLVLSALDLSAWESIWAGVCAAAVALGLLLAGASSLRAGARKT